MILYNIHMLSTIEECIHFIENQVPQIIDLSLERVIYAAEIINNPQNSYDTIHVSGTNGKGSTTFYTSKILSLHNLKVGRFTSPHLVKYNERFSINDKNIDDAQFVEISNYIISNILNKVQLTIFEFLTILGYEYFKRNNVDVAVIEVGLGGRFDATNIILPKIAAITNISIDHQQFFQNDIEKIAYEKFGIFKENSINLHTIESQELITKTLSIQKKSPETTYIAPFLNYEMDENGVEINLKGCLLHFPFYGKHQIRNFELALKIAQNYLAIVNKVFSTELISRSTNSFLWAGRFQNLEKNVFIDGGHNVAGVKSALSILHDHFQNKQFIIVFSVMKDKDYQLMIEAMEASPQVSNIIFYELDMDRALKFEMLKPSRKVKQFNEKIQSEDSNILILGSLYLFSAVDTILNK